MRNQTRMPSTQRYGVLHKARRYEQTRHLPLALKYANERAERWRFRFNTVIKQRDAAQEKVDRAAKLYEEYMNWDGTVNSPYSSSPRQRKQLAEALGIEHDGD